MTASEIAFRRKIADSQQDAEPIGWLLGDVAE